MASFMRALTICASLAALAADATTQTSQQAYLKASNTDLDVPGGLSNDYFSTSLAISGDTIVVGAVGEDSEATGVNGDQFNEDSITAGAAYVFVRNGSTWSQQAYLKASNTDPDIAVEFANDRFGYDVAIWGDTIVVGAPSEDSNATGVNGDQSNNSGTFSGAAYVFVREGTTWTQQAYLKASNTGNGDSFGGDVAIWGDTIVVAASTEDSAATGVNGDQTSNAAGTAGAAYVFVRNGTTWTQQAYLKASNTQANDEFGRVVAISGDTIVVSARQEDSAATGVNGNQSSNAASNSGAAYVFARTGTTWSQQAYLKASNTGKDDFFGISLSISGETIVVGASSEDSNATGVDGDQSNNDFLGAGAAYVFVRSATTWSQQAYLKASNTELSDHFGSSVLVQGDTIVVGAAGEDSADPGVDGNQADNSAPGSGAAYVFVREGTTWAQHAYLKASLPGGGFMAGDDGDSFGETAAISGNTLVVGAPVEDSSATGVNGDQFNEDGYDSGAAYVFTLQLPSDPWVDFAYGLAGLTGVPQLAGNGTLAGGDPMSLALSNAKPLSSAALVLGFSPLGAPFKGGTLVPAPDVLLPGLPTTANGQLLLAATWPTGLPPGFSFLTQMWISDAAGPKGFSASNGLEGTTP